MKEPNSRSNEILCSTDAFIQAELVAKLGSNSARKIVKGLGGSNPLLSGIQSRKTRCLQTTDPARATTLVGRSPRGPCTGPLSRRSSCGGSDRYARSKYDLTSLAFTISTRIR